MAEAADDTPKFEAFKGYLHLKDWIFVPGKGRSVRLIAGMISVIHQDELVGFKVKGGESNWVAQVRGLNSDECVTILGCQVRGFHEIGEFSTDSEVWIVGAP